MLALTALPCGGENLSDRKMPRKDRASWSEDAISKFLDLLIELKNPRHGKYHWDRVVIRLNSQTEKNFDKKQLKNFYDDCKNKFKAWDELKTEWTEIEWNTETGCPIIDTSSEKWKAFTQKYRGVTIFLRKPLPFERKMYNVFKGSVVTDGKSWTSTTLALNLFDFDKNANNDDNEEHEEDAQESDEAKDEVLLIENKPQEFDEVKDDEVLLIENEVLRDKSSFTKKRKCSYCSDTSTRRNCKNNIETYTSTPISRYERMITILQEMSQVNVHGKSFILEVLESLRDADTGDLFLSLPDNEFRLLFLKKKIKFPDDLHTSDNH